jgi:hypothetical protein
MVKVQGRCGVRKAEQIAQETSSVYVVKVQGRCVVHIEESAQAAQEII